MRQCRGENYSQYLEYELAGPWQGRSMRKTGQTHHALAPLLMPGLASHLHEVGHTRGVPDWSWQGVTGAFEKYIGFFPSFQSWDIHKPRENATPPGNLGEVFLSHRTDSLHQDGCLPMRLCSSWFAQNESGRGGSHRNHCTGSTLALTAHPGRRQHGASFPV